jgi:trigger factor
MQAYLDASEATTAKMDADFEADARRSVKAGFILDKLASDEDLTVTAEQLSAYVTEQAYRMGVPADRLAQQLTDNGQLPAVAADVLRGNALTWLAEQATVADEAGRPVDIRATTAASETDANDAVDDDVDDVDAEDADDDDEYDEE